MTCAIPAPAQPMPDACLSISSTSRYRGNDSDYSSWLYKPDYDKHTHECPACENVMIEVVRYRKAASLRQWRH